MKRNRVAYLIILVAVVVSGLLSRKCEAMLPGWLNTYLGDALWALMIYVGFAFLWNRATGRVLAVRSLLFCYAIELSQLYQADWINAIRQTTLGGLVLGFGFLWSDILAYTLGVAVTSLVEGAYMRLAKALPIR